MCEYCNTNDIDRAKALEVFNDYKAKERNLVVSIDNVFEHMLAIYNNVQMADCAVKRIESRNAKDAINGQKRVLAKDVVSELEALLSCHGHKGHNLDGSR